jgi:hypothetical protein
MRRASDGNQSVNQFILKLKTRTRQNDDFSLKYVDFRHTTHAYFLSHGAGNFMVTLYREITA